MKEIFIVEDNEGIRELIEFLLVSNKYSVKSFPDVTSFLCFFSSAKPDLCLLDIMLPDGNGIDLCQQIKSSKGYENLPVILMSAHADVKLAEGADDFISKPFDIDDLVYRIERQVGGNP